MSMERIPGEIYDINCQYFKERNGKKAVWVHRDVVSKLSAISHKCSVEPAQLLDYLLRTGLNTIEHNPELTVKFDLEGVKNVE
jgi:hypothetical protein